MNKRCSLLPFFILVFDSITNVRGGINLSETQNDNGDMEKVDEAPIMDRAVRSLSHNLMPDYLRNVGILRSTRSAKPDYIRSSRSAEQDYLRNIGIMRSTRSAEPPDYLRNVGIMRSTRSVEPDYLRNIGIMRSTRSSDHLRNIGIMRSTRSNEGSMRLKRLLQDMNTLGALRSVRSDCQKPGFYDDLTLRYL